MDDEVGFAKGLRQAFARGEASLEESGPGRQVGGLGRGARDHGDSRACLQKQGDEVASHEAGAAGDEDALAGKEGRRRRSV